MKLSDKILNSQQMMKVWLTYLYILSYKAGPKVAELLRQYYPNSSLLNVKSKSSNQLLKNREIDKYYITTFDYNSPFFSTIFNENNTNIPDIYSTKVEDLLECRVHDIDLYIQNYDHLSKDEYKKYRENCYKMIIDSVLNTIIE